jgi:hypothetical protein
VTAPAPARTSAYDDHDRALFSGQTCEHCGDRTIIERRTTASGESFLVNGRVVARLIRGALRFAGVALVPGYPVMYRDLPESELLDVLTARLEHAWEAQR